jgi:hypothetical protein
MLPFLAESLYGLPLRPFSPDSLYGLPLRLFSPDGLYGFSHSVSPRVTPEVS